MAKKPNWPAIKTRYLNGELPSRIASDYDLTAKQISDKAFQQGWTRKKSEIIEKVETNVENDLQALSAVTLRVHAKFMHKLESQLPYITNPYLFDGEKPNSLYQTAMNNSVKLMQSYLAAKQEAEKPSLPEPQNVNPLDAVEAIKRITGE